MDSIMKEIFPEASEGSKISFIVAIPEKYSMTNSYLRGLSIPRFMEFSVYDANRNEKLARVTAEDIHNALGGRMYSDGKQYAYEKMTDIKNVVSYQPLVVPELLRVDHGFSLVTQPVDSTRKFFGIWSERKLLRIEIEMPESYNGTSHSLFVDFIRN